MQGEWHTTKYQQKVNIGIFRKENENRCYIKNLDLLLQKIRD